MDWIHYIVAPLFCLVGLACVVLVVLQLPGTWIMLGFAVAIELADELYRTPDPDGDTIGTFAVGAVSEWWVLGICAALFALAEVIELVAGMLGAKKGGASRRGMWGAMIGGIVGAIVLTVPLAFIPFLGVLAGALVGTFAGAIIGELSAPEGSTVRGSLKPATGAAIGRIVATVTKVGIAMAGWLALCVAVAL